MYSYIRTEGQNFKTFFKENYRLLCAAVTYLLKKVEYGMEHDANSAYG